MNYFSGRCLNLFAFCTVCVILSGCIQFRTNKIPEDSFEMQFLKSLERSNGSIFVSEDGREDTLWSSKVIYSDPLSCSTRYGMFEILGSDADCDIVIQHRTEIITGGIRLFTEPAQASKPNESNVYFRSSLGSLCYFLDPEIKDYLRDIDIKGVNYENCLVADSTNTEWWPLDYRKGYNDSICEYALSPDVGLLYYTFNDGSRYVRKEGAKVEPTEPRIASTFLEKVVYYVKYTIKSVLSWIKGVFRKGE